jgi:hypothetical protein
LRFLQNQTRRIRMGSSICWQEYMENSNQNRDVDFTLWLEFEHSIRRPEDDPEDDFFNMKISLGSGRCYALNVWTFKFLERTIRAIRSEGLVPQELWQVGIVIESPIERDYLLVPDLLVTRLDRTLVEHIVKNMLRKYGGQLPDQWECPSTNDSE